MERASAQNLYKADSMGKGNEMNFSIFKIFKIFGLVSAWADQALQDGKITLVEAVDLATMIAGVLGINTEIDVPGNLANAATEDEQGPESLFRLAPEAGKPSEKPVED